MTLQASKKKKNKSVSQDLEKWKLIEVKKKKLRLR